MVRCLSTYSGGWCQQGIYVGLKQSQANLLRCVCLNWVCGTFRYLGVLKRVFGFGCAVYVLVTLLWLLVSRVYDLLRLLIDWLISGTDVTSALCHPIPVTWDLHVFPATRVFDVNPLAPIRPQLSQCQLRQYVRNISRDLLNILSRARSAREGYLTSRGKYSMYSTRYFQHLSWGDNGFYAKFSIVGGHWQWAIKSTVPFTFFQQKGNAH